MGREQTVQEGCYVRVVYTAGCAGAFRVRVEHLGSQPFDEVMTAPSGRQYECGQASYRVDVRLTPR